MENQELDARRSGERNKERLQRRKDHGFLEPTHEKNGRTGEGLRPSTPVKVPKEYLPRCVFGKRRNGRTEG